MNSPDDVVAAGARLREAGLEVRTSWQELCCHAVQEKVFVTQPAVPTGEWELYAVTDDEPDVTAAAVAGRCC